MPNLGSGGYEADLAAAEEAVAQGGSSGTAEHAARYVYRLFSLCSLNGDLKRLREVEKLTDGAIASFGPTEDLCLLKANIDFKLHRLAETKRDLALAPALAGRRQGRTILADVAFQEGRYAVACVELETLAAEEGTWDIWARIGHIEAKMGDADEADSFYLRAEEELTAKEMRSYAWVELQRGLLDLARGRVERALEHYSVVDKAYPGYWLTAEHLGDALAATGQLTEAASLYESVVARVDKPETLQKLGELYRKIGRESEPLLERALSAYMESAAMGEVHYYHHLAEFYADVRVDGTEAVKWARKDMELRENFNTQTALAWALHKAKQSAAALPFLESALASGVRDAAIFSKAALIFAAAGEAGRSHEYEHRAAQLNPLRAHVHTH